jgi:hypothetical protein
MAMHCFAREKVIVCCFGREKVIVCGDALFEFKSDCG